MNATIILIVIAGITSVVNAQPWGREYDTLKVFDKLSKAKKQKDQVVFLDLSRKKLHAIPDEVFEMKNLKVLILKGNKIDSLPSKILSLTKLEVINLSDNGIKKFPVVLTQMSGLKKLFLSWNNIDRIPFEVTSLKNLIRLDLLFNDLVDSDADSIRSLMPGCRIFIEARID